MKVSKGVLLRHVHNLKKDMGLPHRTGENIEGLVFRICGNRFKKAAAWKWIEESFLSSHPPSTSIKKSPSLVPAEKSKSKLKREAKAAGVAPALKVRKISEFPKVPKGAFYESREWREVRYEALKLSDGRCCLCGRSKRENGVTIHVDHIKPRSIFPELQLEISNLQLLCEDCNIGKSNYCDIDWRAPR